MLTVNEAAMVQFARKLTSTPEQMSRDDVDTLRRVVTGIDDGEIHDLVNLVGYYAYVNRVVAGLGVRVGGREGAPGQ